VNKTMSNQTSDSEKEETEEDHAELTEEEEE
jgi:hypothetical protein